MLRTKGNGARLNEAEAQPHQRLRGHRVLVEAGREADRVAEVPPEGPHGQGEVVDLAVPPGEAEAQGLQRQPMCALRVEATQQRQHERARSRRHRSLMPGAHVGGQRAF